MTASDRAPTSAPRGRPLLLWSAIAALGGVLCVVLPTWLLPAPEPAPPYGHPLVPWLATAVANLRWGPTLGAFFVLGVVLGAAQPRRRRLMACMAGSLFFLLYVVNFAGDVQVDPTDHNLAPFELVFVAAMVLPVVPGVLLGTVMGRR